MPNNRRRALGAATVAIAVLASTGAAVATTTTQADVSSLATAESKVVMLLHHYKSTAGWKAQYEAAVAKQATDLAKLNTALRVKTVGTVKPTTTTTGTTTTTTATPPTTTSSSTAGVGSTLSFTDENGVPYTVTMSQLIDPATPADNPANYGNRYIAAVFTITDTATASAANGSTSDDANSDATVIGSDDQTYTADFDDVTECTNFNNGLYDLDAGQSVTGCVVFQLATSVTAADVEWSPAADLGGSFGEWKV